MSFSVDLWNGFEIIKSSFSSDLLKLNQLMDILSSYSSYIKDYYNNLINLCESTNETIGREYSIFNKPINLLVNSFKIESEQYKKHYELITKNINEIKEKIEKIKLDINKYFNKNEENTEKFNNVLKELILRQNNFNNSCKELCLNMAEEEANKIFGEKKLNISKQFKHSLSCNVINNKKENNENFLQKAFEAKNDYIDYILESNRKREKYNEKTEKILFNLQEHYKDLLYYFEYLFKQYITDKIFAHNEILESNRLNSNQTFNKINYKNIFNNFVEKNVTKEFPMNTLEFIPFKLNKNFIENQKTNKFIELLEEDQNKVFNLIRNYLKDSKLNFYENDFSKNIFNKQPYKGKNLLKEKEINLDLEGKEAKNELDDLEFVIIHRQKSLKFNKKNQNFNFIKNFIYTLVIVETESKTNEETDTKKEKKDFKNVNEDDRLKYNTILVRFMDLIDPKNEDKFEYLNFFIKYLTINRAKGLFKLNPFVYQIFTNIFTYILMNYKNSYDYVKNIIILAQTFYKSDDNNSDKDKIYLLNGLKNHAVFNEPETWHRAINYNLSLSIKNNNRYSLNIINKEEYVKNLENTWLCVAIT